MSVAAAEQSLKRLQMEQRELSSTLNGAHTTLDAIRWGGGAHVQL